MVEDAALSLEYAVMAGLVPAIYVFTRNQF
jgi:hypothetical protein